MHEALVASGNATASVLLLAEWEVVFAGADRGGRGVPGDHRAGRLHRARRRFRTVFEGLLARDDGARPRREASETSTTLRPCPAASPGDTQTTRGCQGGS